MRLARYWTVLVGALALLPPARAQVAVSAFVDRNVVAVGETVTFTVEVSGASDVDIEPPSASPELRLVQRAPVLRRRSTVGAMERVTIGWLYRGETTGRGEIRGARFRVGGVAYETDPVPVEVTARRAAQRRSPSRARRGRPGTTGASIPSGDLFVRAEPSRETAVVGQQVTVDWVLYFDPSLAPSQSLPVGTWDAPGFWREDLDVPTSETFARPVTLGGRAMRAVTIRRVAVFPARAGTLELAPAQFRIDVDQPRGQDPFDAFFSPFMRSVEKTVEAPATPIEVRPLPAGAPEAFGGGVGQFELSARMSADRVAAGEAVTLDVFIEGTGNAATIEAPELAVPDGVDAYPPESEREVLERTEPLRSTRRLAYTLVPQQGGTVEIPEIAWAYYDTATDRYRTLRAGPFRLTVTGAAAAVAASPAVVTPRWRRKGGVAPPVLWGALALGLALPALGAAGLWIARRPRRERAAPTATPAARLSAARAMAPRAAAAEADRAVRDAVAARLGRPAAGRSRRDLVARLQGSGLSPAGVGAVDAALAEAERARFAPGTSTADGVLDAAEAAVRALS